MRAQQILALLLGMGLALGSLGLAQARAKKDMPTIRISLALPQLCRAEDGTPILPRFLPMRYAAEQFPVVIENVSDKPLQIWAEGNSIGDATLTFEVTGPDGKTINVRPIGQDYSKNIFRTERLLPGEKYVRNILYNAVPPHWDGFPSPAAGTAYKVTLRAILTQKPVAHSKNLELWTGKAISLPQDVIFQR